MMGELIKYFLCFLLVPPFVALGTDARGKTTGAMLPTVVFVGALSVFTSLCFGSLVGYRPHVAVLFMGAFCVWPCALLVAKAINPALTWKTLWISVLLMGWYLDVLINCLDFSSRSNPLAIGAAIILGWIPMAIPFAILTTIFFGFLTPAKAEDTEG